jgi:hypothetical protein
MNKTNLVDRAVVDYLERRCNFFLGMLVGFTGMTNEQINELWTTEVMRTEDKEHRVRTLRLIPGGKGGLNER